MNLVQFVDYLISPQRLQQLLLDSCLDNDSSEAALIYLEDSLNLDSEICLYGVEQTADELVYFDDGIKYIQLFPVEYAADLIKSDLDLAGKGYSNKDIAVRLLDYRLRDA